jgi:hypothetical protein
MKSRLHGTGRCIMGFKLIGFCLDTFAPGRLAGQSYKGLPGLYAGRAEPAKAASTTVPGSAPQPRHLKNYRKLMLLVCELVSYLPTMQLTNLMHNG